MTRPTARQLCSDAKIFVELREDAYARGLLLLAITYGLSAMRLYAEAIEVIAAARSE